MKKHNERNAGRKPMKEPIRLTATISKENIKKFKEFVLTLQIFDLNKKP